MESSSFNLEKKINLFLENFNQNANDAIEDEFMFNNGLIRSRSKCTMDETGVEMAGKKLVL